MFIPLQCNYLHNNSETFVSKAKHLVEIRSNFMKFSSRLSKLAFSNCSSITLSPHSSSQSFHCLKRVLLVFFFPLFSKIFSVAKQNIHDLLFFFCIIMKLKKSLIVLRDSGNCKGLKYDLQVLYISYIRLPYSSVCLIHLFHHA